MSFKDQFKQLKTKIEGYNREHNILPFGQGKQSGQPAQQGYYGGVPPQQQQNLYPGQQQQPQQGQYGQYQQQPGQYAQYQQPSQPQWQVPQQPPPQPQQQQYNRPPPPIPQNSHPGSPPPTGPPSFNQPPPPQQQQQPPTPASKRYWTARFDPSTPVSAEWDQKEGNNNGWGNAELENYTRNSENSFFTNDNKLIIRAITHDGNHTSARLVSRQTLARNRGCLTTFLTLPCAPGIWPAFWLLPREPFTWPNEGEIDIAEAWNGECKNHSCLHWGFYTPEDNWKHRTKATHIPDMPQRPIRFDFVWHESGRMIWYVNNQAVMKGNMPQGARRIEDWCIIMNVAMGGNVCAGQVPKNGAYDMLIHTIYMDDEPEIGGWGRFEADWQRCPEGNTL